MTSRFWPQAVSRCVTGAGVAAHLAPVDCSAWGSCLVTRLSGLAEERAYRWRG